MDYLCGMNRTIRHIEFLLSQHECVIVPGLGAFLSHSHSARQDATSGAWLSPSKIYSFNGGLTQSDGLLVGSVARAEKVSHERALMLVADDVADIRRKLTDEHVYTIGRVGVLSLDENNAITFTTAETDSISPLSGWFPQIKIRPYDFVASEKYEHSVDVHGVFKSFGRFMRVAAAVIILVVIGLAVSTPVSVENAQYADLSIHMMKKSSVASMETNATKAGTTIISKIQKKQLSPIKAPSRIQPQTVDNKATRTNTRDAVFKSKPVVETQQTSKPVISKKTKAKNAPSTALRMNDFDAYCLVIASLTTEDDAYKFIESESRRNPGVAMSVIEQNGRYRIYAATGRTRAQAQAMASTPMLSRYKGAWVTAR